MEQQDGDGELMRRTGTAFARDSDALDPTTQGRLAGARRRALDELERPQRVVFGVWAPVGVAAAIAVAAVGVALTLRAPPDAVNAEVAGDQRTTEMELLLGDDDPALYDEDPEFYGWAAETAGDDAPGNDDAG